MTGISDLFAIGSSGARSYRAALGAVSENVANATTDGYNRRNVVLAESPDSATTAQFYKPGVAFGGVTVQSITRANDPYLDLAARTADGAFQSADVRTTWQSDIQSALDDSSIGVGQLLGQMFTSIERLSSNPQDTTLRQTALFSFEQINSAFRQGSVALKHIQEGISSTAGNEVISVNNALKLLANTNEGLRRAVPGSSNYAQLLDIRDQALATVAKDMDVSVTFGDHGVANVTYHGADVVKGIVPSTFGITTNADSTLTLTLDGNAVADAATGRLAGLAQSASVTKDRLATLNTLAQQYVTDVNGWHQGGVTPAGTPGQPLLSGTDAASLAVLITDPTQIASASSDGTLNGNLLKINDIRGVNGVENAWTSLVSVHANLLNATKTEQTATSLRNQQAQNAKADVSGIDLDREAADLLRLQQCYQGCARIISVARETSQYIFDAVR